MAAMIRKLAPPAYRRMPWKNGKGVTVEIATFPENATLDSFGWRVSMASVTENGPFSSFLGIDRTLSVLSGEGLLLSVEGDQPARLTPHTPPHAFPADQPTHADLLGGPVEDFNVMTRRGEWRHWVFSVGGNVWKAPIREGSVVLIFVWRGDVEIRVDEKISRLNKGETVSVQADHSTGIAVTPSPVAQVYVVILEREYRSCASPR